MRTHEGQARPLNSQEFQEVMENIRRYSTQSLRDTAILLLSFRAGLRAKEIAELELGDVLDNQGQLKRTVSLRKVATKGKKGGVAFLSHPELRDALEAYIVLKRSSISTTYKNVFISRKGTPFSPSSMSRLFSHIYTRAGFEGATGHSGRRSLAKLLNADNVSVYNIQKILRHSNIQTTVTHYLSVDEDKLAEIMERT